MNILYGYIRTQFKQSGNGLIKLILIHILSFLFILLINSICYICGYEDYISLLYEKLTFPSLYPLLLKQPWTIITYSFVHKSLVNLFWDLLMLHALGQRIRTVTHSKYILRLYFLGQTVGAVTFFILYQFSPHFKGIAANLIGPSAAIYAIMAAVCVLLPDLKVHFFFISVQLKYIAMFLLVFAFMHLTSNAAGYYLAQLSGALAGYFYAKRSKNGMDRGGSFFKIIHYNRVKGTTKSVNITKQYK